MAWNGENLVPLGRANSGAAYEYKADPTAVHLLNQGIRNREARATRATALKATRDAAVAKEIHDRLQYKTSGNVYYDAALKDRLYANAEKDVGAIYADTTLTPSQQSLKSTAYIQDLENEGIRSDAHAKTYDEMLGGFRAKPELYNAPFADTFVASKLHGEGDIRQLPREVDPLAIHQELTGNANLYNEKGWVDAAAKTLFPERVEKYGTPGQYGGTHMMNEAKVRLVKTDGQGRALKNADGSWVLDIKDSDITAMKSIPEINLLLNKRISDYDKLREADPNLPKMTERGHIAQMVNRLAVADETRTVGLNAQVPRGSSGEGSAKVSTPFDESKVVPVQIGANINTLAPEFKRALGVDVTQSMQSGVFSPRKAGAPTIPQTNGTRKPVEVEALYSRQVVQEDSKGNLTVNDNNTIPISGILGEAYDLPVNPKTGQLAYPKNKADYDRLLKDGYQPESYVAVYTDKNEDFTADYNRHLKQLVAQNEQAETKKAYGDLEAKARKAASAGVSRKLIPFNDETAASINNKTPYYAGFNQGTIKSRSSAPRKVVDWGPGKQLKPGTIEGGIKTTGGKAVIKW